MLFGARGGGSDVSHVDDALNRRDKLLAQAIKSYCDGMVVSRPSAWESIEFCYPSSFDTLNLARTHIQRFCLWIHSVVSCACDALAHVHQAHHIMRACQISGACNALS
jgi:hypothetical protein